MRNEKHYRPCVGICLFNRQGQVFTGKRLDVPDYAWMMPQGGIDDGEDYLMAARRELYEETGVTSATFVAKTEDWLFYDLPSARIAAHWRGKYLGQKQVWYLFAFDGAEDEIDISGIAGEKAEFSSWGWMDLKMVVEQVVPFKAEVYKEVLKAFQPQIEQSIVSLS